MIGIRSAFTQRAFAPGAEPNPAVVTISPDYAQAAIIVFSALLAACGGKHFEPATTGQGTERQEADAAVGADAGVAVDVPVGVDAAAVDAKSMPRWVGTVVSSMGQCDVFRAGAARYRAACDRFLLPYMWDGWDDAFSVIPKLERDDDRIAVCEAIRSHVASDPWIQMGCTIEMVPDDVPPSTP